MTNFIDARSISISQPFEYLKTKKDMTWAKLKDELSKLSFQYKINDRLVLFYIDMETLKLVNVEDIGEKYRYQIKYEFTLRNNSTSKLFENKNI